MRRGSMVTTGAPRASSSDSSTRQNVRVICRVRPVNKKEQAAGGVTCVKVQNTVHLKIFLFFPHRTKY